MFWADSLGSKYIHSKLDEWSKAYGDFFKPCAFLAERASKGAPLVIISLLFLSLSNQPTSMTIYLIFSTFSFSQ